MKIFHFGALLFYVEDEVFIEVPLFQETYSTLPKKTPGCAPVTLILSFHPDFHRNIWVFANLPTYRKHVHDNISLAP